MSSSSSSSWLGTLVYYLKCSPIMFSESAATEVLKNSDGNEGEDSDQQQPGEDGKRRPGGWRSMPCIIGNETFERVASYGLTANLTIYLVSRYNMGQVVAANVTNIFNGTTNFAPLLGAFISDAYWGRFRTLAYASVASFLGMVVLTLTAAVPALRPPSCSPTAQPAGQCPSPSKPQLGVLILSLALLTMGSAGVRPCSLPFGVDQFDRATPLGRSGLASFFNWYYCTSTAGVVAAMTLVVYIQNSVSWAVGFGVPAALMLFAIAFFLSGTRLYVYVAPEGSILSGIAQVVVAAIRKRSLALPAPDDPLLQEAMLHSNSRPNSRAMRLPLTLQFSFLNKAAIKCEGDQLREDGTPANPWRLCGVQQVEELKCLMRIVPIWASGIVCFMAMAQQLTFAVLQSLMMDRHLGPRFQIPPGSIPVIALAALTLSIPVYDQLFVPAARRLTGLERGVTLLQRQGIGMAISAASMVVAGLVEKRRRESALAHGGLSPMSAALWLSPQLVMLGVAEAFNAVGQVEFYNREFPEHMQTIAGSLFYCSIAGANYLSSLLVEVLRRNTGWLNDNIDLGRVDYFYYVIAAMGAGNLLYFLVVAHFYRYKGTGHPKEEGIGFGL